MPIADRRTYLADITKILRTHWPQNRTVNIICHGHSVPAGYFATPMVDTFHAYPHLLHRGLKERFPYAVLNVIVTARGGEHSAAGAERFEAEVLCHRPDIVMIDYGLNDRGIGLDAARQAWTLMMEAALQRGARVILLTPTMDQWQARDDAPPDRRTLPQHAEQIRRLAESHGVGLSDTFAAWEAWMRTGDLNNLLSWSNHPNTKGHDLVATELLRWFPAA